MREALHINAVTAATLAAGLLCATASYADSRKYDPGASDIEIKIGQTMPYSGPASALSVIGKVEAAYFKMVNDRGGINGRKINLISYDDAASPAKTVEQVRKLDEILKDQDTIAEVMQKSIDAVTEPWGVKV